MLYIFLPVLYIFANFSLEFWSNFCAPPTTYCRASPSNSISKTLSHIYNLCWLFIYVQKQSRSMIVVISMCSVLMIFFFFFFWEIGFVLYIFCQERKKNYCCYLCYTFSWVSVCVCKDWFGNCKICSVMKLQVMLCYGF